MQVQAEWRIAPPAAFQQRLCVLCRIEVRCHPVGGRIRRVSRATAADALDEDRIELEFAQGLHFLHLTTEDRSVEVATSSDIEKGQ